MKFIHLNECWGNIKFNRYKYTNTSYLNYIFNDLCAYIMYYTLMLSCKNIYEILFEIKNIECMLFNHKKCIYYILFIQKKICI